MLRTDQPKTLGTLDKKEYAAVMPLKEVVICSPVLALTRMKRQYIFKMDAFHKEIGHVVLQNTAGRKQPP